MAVQQRRHRALVIDIGLSSTKSGSSLYEPFKEHVEGFGTVYGVVIRPGTLWFTYIWEVHRLLCRHPTRQYAQWWHDAGLGGIGVYFGAFDSDAHFRAFLDDNPSSRAVVERFAQGRLFVHAVWCASGASVLPSDRVASAVLRGHRFESDSFPNRVIYRRIFPMTEAEIRNVVAHPHHTLTFDVFRDPEALTLARFRHPSLVDGDDDDLVVINRRWGIETFHHMASATIPDARTIALPRALASARARESTGGRDRCCCVS